MKKGDVKWKNLMRSAKEDNMKNQFWKSVIVYHLRSGQANRFFFLHFIQQLHIYNVFSAFPVWNRDD